MTDAAPTAERQDWPGLDRALTMFALVCVAAACLLYVWRLQDTPAAIGGDEAFFANHGLSIARTGADLNGRHWPLVIQLDPNVDPGLWYQAMLVYLDAIAFTMLPFAEWSARLPVALLAIVNIALAWSVAARFTRHRSAGPVAAMVIALSPIYFFLSRQVVDYICPVFFVLLWLRAVVTLDERSRPRDAFVCGLILAVGVFSYVSSWLMMPVYLLCTIAFCLSKPRRWALSLAAVAGFSIPAGALVLWLAAHPDAWNSVFHRYAGQSMHLPRFNMNGYYRVVDFVSAYWTCWNPAQLFLVGSPNPIIGVRSGGVFAAPVAILFGAGLLAMSRPGARQLLLVAGLLTAPLGPVLYGTPGAIQRQLVLVPFVAIVAGAGAVFLLSRHAAVWRMLAAAAVVASPVVFAVAADDVFAGREDYITRFDPSNFRDLTPALAALDGEAAAPQVVVTIGPYDRRAYWLFHTTKIGNTALRDKALFWEPDAFRAAEVAPGSLVIASSGSALAARLDHACPRVAAVRAEAEVVVWRATTACLAQP